MSTSSRSSQPTPFATDAEPMGATWRKMVGIALLWVALASLVQVSNLDRSMAPFVAILGFAAFAGGLSLFADGLKRSIVAALRAGE